MDIYVVTPHMLDKQGIYSNETFSDSKPFFPIAFVESWAPFLLNSGDAVAAGSLVLYPPRVLGSLKCWPPPLTPGAVSRGASFWDLHVAEILVELNYFYTQTFRVADVLRSVSFGRRLGETFQFTEE